MQSRKDIKRADAQNVGHSTTGVTNAMERIGREAVTSVARVSITRKIATVKNFVWYDRRRVTGWAQ